MLHSIVGWECLLGSWSRVEGYPSDPNPNDPHARVPQESLFNTEGRLNPSITILGMSPYRVLSCDILSLPPSPFSSLSPFSLSLPPFSPFLSFSLSLHSPSPGQGVSVRSELMVLNSIVLPHKDINRGYHNQIIL